MSKPVRATTTLVHTPPPAWPPRPRRHRRESQTQFQAFTSPSLGLRGDHPHATASRPETQTPRSPQTTVACAGPRAGGAGPSTPRQRGARARAPRRGGIVQSVRSSNDVFAVYNVASPPKAHSASRKATPCYIKYTRLEIAILRLLYTVDNFLRLRLYYVSLVLVK